MLLVLCSYSYYKYVLINGKTVFFSTGNIPDDQRVLDPRMGPIKKTAAVKTLPRL